MQADTHTLFKYPLGKPLEAKLLKETQLYVCSLLPKTNSLAGNILSVRTTIM